MNHKQMQEFMSAIDAIVNEKGIDKAVVIEAMEQAMAAAYKKKGGLCRCEVNPETGEIKLFSVRTVVEDENFYDERSQISLSSAKEIVDDIEVGETIENRVEMTDFGRVAAGTAKQVVVQRIKEAEKELIVNEFGDKQDEMLIGLLSREDANTYYVDLGKTFGLLPKDEVIPGEKLEMGSQVKVYVSKLEISNKGIFMLLSRCHYGFLKRLLESEIPEINEGLVMLYSVARDAGNRSKIAVYSESEGIDPIGSVIGANGSRINRVLKQIGKEKIDVVLYDKNIVQFIKNALSPAKNIEVFIPNPKKKEAICVVDKDNFSLAIGKKGINVRLASKLTHYKLDVKRLEDVDIAEYKEKYSEDVSFEEDENVETDVSHNYEEVKDEDMEMDEEHLEEVENHEEDANA